MSEKHSPGDRIIELCKTYALSRETLAERSGLEPDLIRRIEEGHIPDLAPLLKISRALGVRLGTLLDDHEELGPVVTRAGEAGESVRFITGLAPAANAAAPTGAAPHAGGLPTGTTATGIAAGRTGRRGLRFHTLAADKAGRHMEPFIVDIEAHAEQAKSAHEGEEFVHVLSGDLQIEYGDDTYSLSQGDSIYYDSIVPHRLNAASGNPLRILAVIYTPS
ncbi:MAG: cupin domain-containing protein [Treponema sp.]|jgi:transcriptional regulator with XRE-family HTH domain/quercetin dioxygenase-like cupin family protein|nr:cupin domain-containing protein [Treponema sp.]